MINSTSNKTRNPELFESMWACAKAFVRALGDVPFVNEYGSWYDRVKVLVGVKPEVVAEVLKLRPDLRKNKKQMELAIPLAGKCLEALLSGLSSGTPPHATTQEAYRDELTLLLGKVLKEMERNRVRRIFTTPQAVSKHLEALFIQEYLKYESYLYDDEASDCLIGLLENVVCPDELEVRDGLTIGKISQDEWHSLVEAEKEHGYELESYPESVLRMRISEEDDGEDLQEHMRHLITSMRLLKEQKVGLSRIYHAWAVPARPWEVIEKPEGTGLHKRPIGSPYSLDKSEEDDLKGLFSLLDQSERVGYLAVSIRRFNAAHEREKMEDRWIDYFVSLESLYTKDGEKAEVTHRLSTRAARVLGTDYSSRIEVMTRMKKWYGNRSSIVHGSEVTVVEPELNALEKALRDSLKWFMERKRPQAHDDILSRLDLGS